MNHEQLMKCTKQHKIKNIFSNGDDFTLRQCSSDLVYILEKLLPEHTFSIRKYLTLAEVEAFCGAPISLCFMDRKIIPDSGIIWMDGKYPLLMSEIKRQGTNDELEIKQATGNAIERYGKNLNVAERMFRNEYILPVVMFCWGCDFADDQTTTLAKLYELNYLYDCNKKYYATCKGIKPSNIFYQEKRWEKSQIIDIEIDLAFHYAQYYLEKEEKCLI